MAETTKIIEINGIKVEVDLRTAKQVNSYKVGDKIKVLIKSYGDNYRAYAGLITSFDCFEKLPSIGIAYIEESYSTSCLKFVTLNAESKDIEICPAADTNELSITKDFVLQSIDRKIESKQAELLDLENQKQYLLTKFTGWFEPALATNET